MIFFNRSVLTGNELSNLKKVLKSRHLSGDGDFTKKTHKWLEKKLSCQKVLLTTSGTHALELASLLARIKPGDEVIMSSFTFVSTANAFVLRGAKIVFVDIRPDTLNIDENLIENAITDKTKAIVLIHYAGVACDMDKILKIARENKLLVIEDAAQALFASYKKKYLGTLGDLAAISFHGSKNYTSGEGGALFINDSSYNERAEIIRNKGTKASSFFGEQQDRYNWEDLGSSYLPSELNAAFLYAQLKNDAQTILEDRLKTWDFYYKTLLYLQENHKIELPTVPGYAQHNAHTFYIKVKDKKERKQLLKFLNHKNVEATSHYHPLHLSPGGQLFSRFEGIDNYTSSESLKLVRLPIYYHLKKKNLLKICDLINNFYKKH